MPTPPRPFAEPPPLKKQWGASSILQRWFTLGRDSRDTLFLLAVIAWTLAPHVPRLPEWSVAFAGLAMLWRARIAWRGGKLPSRWVLGGCLIVTCALTWWSHHTLLGQEAGITLIVALTAMKTLELRARRDAFVVFFLGFFLILTQFLYSQSLLTALAMTVAVWGLLTALVLAHLPVGRPHLFTAAGLAARNAAMGVPIMVLLFLLFPRLAPLWGRPEDAVGHTGLSGQMNLGQIAELALDDSIAMRVRFLDGKVPLQRDLYFRGPVLSQFDGQQWKGIPSDIWLRAAMDADTEVRVTGRPLRYELTIEPTRGTILPLLEASIEPPHLEGANPVPMLEHRGLQWLSALPITDRIRVHGLAWTHFQYGPTTPNSALAVYLELPPGRNPRTLAWAVQFKRRPDLAHADARALSQALLSHIEHGGFSYTLAPGLFSDNAIDDFWLDRRAGFCEHFASAFVVLMRAMDVPARIVTGYQGAELNKHDGYWVVRNRDAHAWAEFWQPGEGWVRVDPTGAVAPDRIELPHRLTAPRGLLAGALSNVVSPLWFNDARAAWEAMNNGWNQWVLNYSQGRQINMMRQLGFETADWLDLVKALLVSLIGLSVAATAWVWWEQQQHDRWLLAYSRVQSALRKAGLDIPAHWPPLTLANSLSQRLGSAAQPLADALMHLDALRYARPDTLGVGGGLSMRRRQRLMQLARGLAAQIERQTQQEQS